MYEFIFFFFPGNFSSQGDRMIHVLGTRFYYVTLDKIQNKLRFSFHLNSHFSLPFSSSTLAAFSLRPCQHSGFYSFLIFSIFIWSKILSRKDWINFFTLWFIFLMKYKVWWWWWWWWYFPSAVGTKYHESETARNQKVKWVMGRSL